MQHVIAQGKHTNRPQINQYQGHSSSSVRKGLATYMSSVPGTTLCRLIFRQHNALAIAQLVERRTVVGNIKLTSLGRWFKSASRELFHFARTFLEKHLRPGRPKGMPSLLVQ